MQLDAFVPGVKVQVPTTTPLLRLPTVVVVPLEVPVNCPVKARTVPLVFDLMFRLRVPVTCPALLVVKEAVPVSVWSVARFVKHAD